MARLSFAAADVMNENPRESLGDFGESPSRLEELLDSLNQRPAEFRDERLAPSVDHELLRALASHELSEEAARPLFHLIHSFRSWRDAYRESLVESFRRENDDPPDADPSV